jgi:hypothetical protein
MLSSEPALLHQALEGAYERLYAGFGGARFERRGDLIVAVLPGVPIPQCNGAWVSEDSASAADALAEVVAEVEAAGEWPWVQTRLGQERAQHAAVALGLTHEERVPAMLVLPDEVVETVDGQHERRAPSLQRLQEHLGLRLRGVHDSASRVAQVAYAPGHGSWPQRRQTSSARGQVGLQVRRYELVSIGFSMKKYRAEAVAVAARPVEHWRVPVRAARR